MFRILAGVSLAATLSITFSAAAATPREECAPSSVPLTCLDAKLRQANLRLNAALKSVQERIEKLQREGRRSVQTAFVNSQRQFNAYRDSNCSWQAIAAPPAETALHLKDCQIRATVAREEELLAFARGETETIAAATALEPVPTEVSSPEEGAAPQSTAVPSAPSAVPVEEAPAPRVPAPAKPATAVADTGSRMQWRLVKWAVTGTERDLVPDSQISVAFDPAGKCSGNASINSFSGRYRFDDDGRLVWSLAGFVTTRMAGPPELMKQEDDFLKTLRRMTYYRVDGTRLILESASRHTELTFER